VGTRILSVEDDERIRTAVKLALEDEGWTVDEAGSGEEAIDLFNRVLPDVVLIDIMLPGIDGFELCRTLRRNSDVPIVMVTARNDTHDVVAGLEAGADDYLTKPFGVNELLARIRVALRHAHGASGPSSPVVEIGGLKLDLDRREVFVDGKEVHLTPIEYKLLVLLAKHAGKVLTHRQILKEVWGPNQSEHTHYVRVHMAELRKKIEGNPARPVYLATEPGVGYRLRDRPGEAG